MMKDGKFHEEFAKQWIDAWNRHDLNRIMSFYDDAMVFSSTKLAKVSPASDGKAADKSAVREYWAQALALRPNLQFKLIAVLKGIDSAVIHYKGVGGELCAEFFYFDERGMVVESHAHSARI